MISYVAVSFALSIAEPQRSEKRDLLRSDFVATHDECHLSAPGVDEGRPTGVDGQILSAAGAHSQRRILEWLPSKLED